METTQVQKWNKIMKTTFIAMMMIAVLSITSVVLDAIYPIINRVWKFYHHYYADFNLARQILGYLTTAFWIFGMICLFCLPQLANKNDKNGLATFRLGVVLYISFVILGYILSWFGLMYFENIIIIIVMLLLKMGCFILMMIGAIKLSKSKTFPNSKGMSMIMISAIFTILAYVYTIGLDIYYYKYYYMSYDYYGNSNIIDTLQWFGYIFSMASDIFWLIGWAKLAKPIKVQ